MGAPGDGEPALQAQLNHPFDLALGDDGTIYRIRANDPDKNSSPTTLYIADTGKNVIRQVTLPLPSP